MHHQVLLRQLGEWVRIRGALKQFMMNVKVSELLAVSHCSCFPVCQREVPSSAYQNWAHWMSLEDHGGSLTQYWWGQKDSMSARAYGEVDPQQLCQWVLSFPRLNCTESMEIMCHCFVIVQFVEV